MIRFLSFLMSLLMGLLSSQVFAGEYGPPLRFLKSPQVRWENELLIGELKDVPLKGVLQELSLKEGFQLEVIGDLKEKVDVSFDHLTLEQSIKKIMRATGLNYVMITEEGGSTEMGPSNRIKKLIVCLKDKTSRGPEIPSPPRSLPRERVEVPPGDEPEEGLSPHLEPDHEREEMEQEEEARRSKVEFQGAPEDLRKYVDKLSGEGRISPEEYQMIMEKIKERK